jgi:ATP-dependent Zn protease
MIDNEIYNLIKDAYGYAECIVKNSKDFILEGAELLKDKKTIKSEQLMELMNTKYSNVYDMFSK